MPRLPDVIDHSIDTTVVGIEAKIPGYSLKFFISHKVETDSTKSISPTLDTTTQKAVN